MLLRFKYACHNKIHTLYSQFLRKLTDLTNARVSGTTFAQQTHLLKHGKTFHLLKPFPAGIYLLKVNNRNTRTKCEICSKLTIKTPERRLASFWCLYC